MNHRSVRTGQGSVAGSFQPSFSSRASCASASAIAPADSSGLGQREEYIGRQSNRRTRLVSARAPCSPVESTIDSLNAQIVWYLHSGHANAGIAENVGTVHNNPVRSALSPRRIS